MKYDISIDGNLLGRFFVNRPLDDEQTWLPSVACIRAHSMGFPYFVKIKTYWRTNQWHPAMSQIVFQLMFDHNKQLDHLSSVPDWPFDRLDDATSRGVSYGHHGGYISLTALFVCPQTSKYCHGICLIWVFFNLDNDWIWFVCNSRTYLHK